MCIWVTSDTHFAHANIIGFCNRPFKDIDKHDESLIATWNAHVGKDDKVYHLGDFTLGNEDVAETYFQRLNGLICVLGYNWHHDKRWLPVDSWWREVNAYFRSASGTMVEIYKPIIVLEDVYKNEDGRGVPAMLCHYPFEEWDRKHYGAIHLHGHSHGNTPRVPGRLDVGVDNAYKLVGEYRPLRLEECVTMIRSWKGDSSGQSDEMCV